MPIRRAHPASTGELLVNGYYNVTPREPHPIALAEEPMPRPVHADLAALRALAAEGVPDVVLCRGLAVWAQLFGTVSFELCGHLHNVVHDDDAMFRHQMRRAGRYLVTGA